MLNLKKIRERGLNLRLFWDLFMVTAAVVNLLLILFDFTYFYARPFYYQYAPQIVAQYDPYKGARPHPRTERFLDLARQWTAPASESELDPEPIREQLRADLLRTAERMQEDNPFAENGRPEDLRNLQARMATALLLENALPETEAAEEDLRFADTAAAFFRMPENAIPEEVRELRRDRARVLEAELAPLLERNYQRAMRADGSPVDHFLLLDAPFLALFWIEFLVRWLIAIRRGTYLRWWLFPLYNWYDVLGLIPVQELRIFRLARIVSIYVRLHRSDLTTVGDDIVSRTVKRYSAILTEEISDRVAVRILTEMQDEIRSGASVDILLEALEPRRARIKALLVENIERFTQERPGQEELRKILEQSLNDAAGRVPSLRLVPDFLKETLTREIGLAVFDAINDALARNLRGEVGQGAVADMIDFALDELQRSGGEHELSKLYTEITLDVLENLKTAVAVKKWSLADSNDASYRATLFAAQRRGHSLPDRDS